MSEARSQSVGPDPATQTNDQLIKAGRRAAVDCEAKMQTAKAALELRNEWVVRLYDAGVGLKETAETMLISRARVVQIVASH